MGATELRISCEHGKNDVPRLVELALVLYRFQQQNQNYLALLLTLKFATNILLA